MMRSVVLSISVGLAVAGCATPNQEACDRANREISLLTMASSALTGSYGACLQSMRAELDALRLESRSLEIQASALEAEAAQLDGERRAAARRLAAVNNEQAELLALITEAAERGSLGDAQGLLDDAQSLTDEINDLNDTGGIGTAEEAEIRQRQQRLNRLADVMLAS